MRTTVKAAMSAPLRRPNPVIRFPSRSDLDLPRGMDAATLVTVVGTGKVDGHEEALANLYLDTDPKKLISFFASRGVDKIDLVETYERVKAATGCRSEAFERSLAGQFVFTS